MGRETNVLNRNHTTPIKFKKYIHLLSRIFFHLAEFLNNNSLHPSKAKDINLIVEKIVFAIYQQH